MRCRLPTARERETFRVEYSGVVFGFLTPSGLLRRNTSPALAAIRSKREYRYYCWIGEKGSLVVANGRLAVAHLAHSRSRSPGINYDGRQL